MTRAQLSSHRMIEWRKAILGLAAFTVFATAGCASEPPPPPPPSEPEPVVQPEPKPEPPRPTYSIELQYPNGPVTFVSQCDYSSFVDKLREVHSSDQNVHAALKHVEGQGFDCEGRVTRLEDYLRNLGALK